MVYGILHRADHLHLVIGDFDVEGFFHGDDQFRDVERVGAEIFQKGGSGNDGFGGVSSWFLMMLMTCSSMDIDDPLQGTGRDCAACGIRRIPYDTGKA